MRPLRSLVVLAVVALVLATPASASILDLVKFTSSSGPYTISLVEEIEETGRNDLDARGQRNCVPEAANGGTPTCPRTPTQAKLPVDGVLILEATWFTPGPTEPVESAETTAANPQQRNQAILADTIRGTNAHRASGGLAPSAILPGVAQLKAWYGRWHDDGDRRLRVSGAVTVTPDPDNEWVGVPDALVVGYVEPGSRPAFTSASRPAAEEPDVRFRYDRLSAFYVQASDELRQFQYEFVVFADGSLLNPIETIVATNVLFAPSADGQRPFTATASSLIDIDVYATVAPAPIAGVYASSLQPTVTGVASPSLGLCPARCATSPAIAEGTPLAPVAGPVASERYAAYEIEHEPGSGHSRAGRYEEHVGAWAPWSDLRVLQGAGPGPAAIAQGPLAGRTLDGRMTAEPGAVLVLEAWTGAWNDLDGNGRVGRASPDGLDPFVDDYVSSLGEYAPFRPAISAQDPKPATVLFARFVPDVDWGAGVVLLDELGMPICGGQGSMPGPNCAQGVFATGATEIRVPLSAKISQEGRYEGRYTLLLPTGSPGFRACLEPVHLRYAVAQSEFVEVLSDCDRIAAYAGGP